MGQRRILVIGSQCEALTPLDFLPDAAQALYAVMTDPERGACVSAIDGEGLLIDPVVADVKEAIRNAYIRASNDEATLFVAYIGHGDHADDDFYLLPRDAQVPPTSDTAIHLTNLIKEAHRNVRDGVDGLALLIDACYSGVAGFSAAQAWVAGLRGTLRFEVLTAAADRPAANGCFSRTLAKLLREGITAVPSQHLLCAHLRSRIARSCPNQVPQHPAYNPDETLWLARNAGGIRAPWAQTPVADEVQRLTMAYQVTPDLENVVARSEEHRCVGVIGEAGTGKSVLAAALAWSDVSDGAVPSNFVQAVAFLTEATTPHELARMLSQQLSRSVPRLREAQHAFAKQTLPAEQQRLGVLERQVVGPLRSLAPESIIRVVIDGLDRLATGARVSVMGALTALVRLPFLHLIVTARLATELPDGALIHVLGPAPSDKVRRYLEQRAVAQMRHTDILSAGRGNWLVVRVLADLVSQEPEADMQKAKLALSDVYEELLARSGAGDNPATRRVMSTMAAAGSGPVVPLSLLRAASEKQGGPATQVSVRDELFRLRGLAVRAAAGSQEEHVGLFHQTLAEHLADHFPEETLASHRALVECIETLAPPGPSFEDLSDPIRRYAFEREAEHLWALGAPDKVFECLSARRAILPQDNLRRWRAWGPRFQNELGPDHLYTLLTRGNIAASTSISGDIREALRLYRELLIDQVRVFGADHPDTLATRANIGSSIADCGEPEYALHLTHELLLDRVRVLGADHPDTLRTRRSIAHLTGRCGDARNALRLFHELLRDEVRVLGVDHQRTYWTRMDIAWYTADCGDKDEALRVYQELLPDQMRVLGAYHPDTLTTRNNIALYTGACGDVREALRKFQELLPDQVHVFGADHSNTLGTRMSIAFYTAKCGDKHEALRMYQELLPDQMRVLGADHSEVLRTRMDIASYTAGCDDKHEALRIYQELLPDQMRVLGVYHPDTFETRSRISLLTFECGDKHEALRLFQELLPDQMRVFHPRISDTEGWIRLLQQLCR